MNIDVSRFNQLFFDECTEHLDEMERIFLEINPSDPDREELNALFRAAHSIKGGAGIFGFPDMVSVTHTIETLLDRVRHDEIALTSEMLNLFLQAGDVITMQLAGHRDGTMVDEQAIQSVCGELGAISANSLPALQPPRVDPVGRTGDSREAAAGSTYRIVFTPPPNLYTRMVRMEPIFADLATMGDFTLTARFAPHPEFPVYDPTRCLAHWEMILTTSCSAAEVVEIFMFVADEEEISIEQLPPVAMTAGRSSALAVDSPPVSHGKEAATTGATSGGLRGYDHATTHSTYGRRREEHVETTSIRVGVAKVDQLINQMGELVITQSMLAQSAKQLDPVQFENFHRSLSLLERTTRDLQESVMSIRMVPISFIFNRFQRLVHDLAESLGKRVELKLEGETTELDKGLIEQLADPLTHLVRNSLDHGIESPELRVTAGKPAVGVITLRASQQGGRIVVEVTDDGAGLNRERILDKAAQNGVPTSDSMSDEEVWQLIFTSGFSTADQVTNLSGRGVGMDVVQRNVTAMGGRVILTSTQGRGSRVFISLPLTLAILDGLLVRVGSETFIVPLNSIIESLQPRTAALNEVAPGQSTVHVRGNYLPLIRLGELFAIPEAVQRPEDAIVMLIDADGEQLALLVDELLGQHQVVIKSLETNYRKVAGTAGATILGDGQVALILDAVELVRLWRSQ